MKAALLIKGCRIVAYYKSCFIASFAYLSYRGKTLESIYVKVIRHSGLHALVFNEVSQRLKMPVKGTRSVS